MTEAGFRLFNQAFAVTAEGIYAVLLTAFFRPFLAEPPGIPRNLGQRDRLYGKRYSKPGRLLTLCAAYLLFERLCHQTALPQGSFGLLLAVLLLAAARWLGLARPLAFLLTLLYFNVRISSGLMVESLYFVVERLFPFRPEQLEAVFLRAAFLVTLFLLSHVSLMTGMLYALRQQMTQQRFPLHRRELCYLSLIPLAGILFGQVISRLLIEVKDGALLQLYERHPAFLAVVPTLALLFYGGAYLTIVFQQGMAALREEQATHYIEYQQAQAIRMRLHEVEQLYRQVRQLKHEMRGHLTNIKGLAQSGAYASLEDYIARMDASLNDLTLTLQTGNPVTDVIVNDKRQQCQEARIRFQVAFHYPESGAYDAFDIGIILQNLLQNAVEACEKITDQEPDQKPKAGHGQESKAEPDRKARQAPEPEQQSPSGRFIALTGRQRGRFFLLEVRNSYTGEVVFDPDGLPLTTKTEDLPLHGLGLSNVRRAAEKYNGELELQASSHEFAATVLLQERSSI